ncbi:MAG: GSCFA domain-containing protein [Bacteroidia bacterium]
MFKQKLTLDVAAYYHKNNGVCGFSYTDALLCIGSCFAENMGERLVEHKFNAVVNPYGIVFNPLVLAQQLNAAIHNIPLNENDILYTDGLYFSYQAHSSVYATSKEELITKLNNIQHNLIAQLKNAHYLILTWGSAYYYTRANDGAMVSNCHKQPQALFSKEFCTAAQIEVVYTQLIQQLQTINPTLQLLLTVSPVRYVRDGIIENNNSKAQLISATHTLIQCNENVFYFPAYELVIDDLRDYRYFATDKVHPSTEAIDYVWQVFITQLLSKHDAQLFDVVQRIVKAAKHRTLHPQALSSKAFNTAHLHLCEQTIQQYPYINLQHEIQHFTTH